MAPRSDQGRVLFMVLAIALASLIPGQVMTGPARAAGIVVNDDIYENTTWTLGNSPVYVTDSITVNKGYTLTIEPGVTVKFDHWDGLTVEGTLKAPGKVIFTTNATVPVAGDWDGLTFDGAAQENIVFTNMEIHYASTGMDITNTQLSLSGMLIDRFTYSALDMNTGSGVIITNSVLISSDSMADGIDCNGNLKATSDTIAAHTAIYADNSCSGSVDKSIITTYSSYGVEGESGSSLTVQNSLINSTAPDMSEGVYANADARLTIKGDDIVGHETGIYWDSSFGSIDAVSVRNCFSLAIEADTPISVTGSFVGSPSPVTGSYWDSDINDKVTIVNPIGAPVDLPGIPQPPTAYIKTPAPKATVSGKVGIEGQAWDPDAGDTITSVEVRVSDVDSATIFGWSKCDGTTSWKCSWDTTGMTTAGYFISARVISGKDSILTNKQVVVVQNQVTGPNVTDPLAWYGVYAMICIGAVVAIVVVIIIVVVVIFVFRGKKKETPPQPAYQPYPQQYQAAYPTYPTQAYQPQPMAPVQPEQPKPAPAEEVIIEDVFLIYKDGRLIHHDTRRLKPEVDDQMLGGMFTAIQEFIGQSFPAEDGTKGMVKEISYGDSRVVLEHGNFVYLAVVTGEIKDTKPLHRRMEKLIKEIEGRCANNLEKWDGNMESVHDAKRMVKLIYSEEDIDNFV